MVISSLDAYQSGGYRIGPAREWVSHEDQAYCEYEDVLAFWWWGVSGLAVGGERTEKCNFFDYGIHEDGAYRGEAYCVRFYGAKVDPNSPVRLSKSCQGVFGLG